MRKYEILKPLKKYWYLCLIYIVVSIGLTEITIVSSNMMADATDRLFAGKSPDIMALLIPLIIFMILGGIAAFIKSFSKNTLTINMQTDIRNIIVTKLVKLQYSYFDEEGTGALLNKLVSDIFQIEMLFSESLPELLVGIIAVTTVGIYIGLQSVRLFLVTIICYPVLLWIANKTTIQAGHVSKIRRNLYDKLENTALDAIQGITVGKSFNLYETQKQRIFRVIDAILDNEVIRTKISSVNQLVGRMVRWLPKMVCYLFCLYEVGMNKISVGSMLAYVILFDNIAKPLGEIPGYILSMREYIVSLDRLQDVLSKEEEPSGDLDFDMECENVIELNHIGFHYADDNEVLKDINMTIKKGCNVAFVGKSGGGKSTAMKILCGFYYPQKGSYRIYGHDFNEWNLNALRDKIGLVSQNVFLFPVSIAENVSYGKEDATMQEIMEACKKADIHDFIMQLPEGYDTLVGERGARLSGGQKQRLSIARAFLKDAPILLLDEPTSAVDLETEMEIQKSLKRISEDRTVITVAHRLSTVMDADEIYVFDNGEIVEKGTHEQLLELKNVYYSLYDKEAGYIHSGEKKGVN